MTRPRLDTAGTGARVRIGALAFDPVTEDDVVAHVMSAIAAGTGGRVETANLNHLWHCRAYPGFAAYCDAASLVVADGMPIVWAGALQGTPLPERVTGSSVLWGLSRAAAAERRRVFLAGGDEDTADRAAAVLSARIPGLTIAGTDRLPPRADGAGPNLDAFVDALRDTAPDIVFLALPTVPTWRTIVRCAPENPGTWWVGVGAGLGFAAGTARRAPEWQQRAGLEWLHRLTRQPLRLSRRYLVQGPPTAARLFISALRHRVSRPAAPRGDRRSPGPPPG